MRLISLITTAIFLAPQFFSQDIEKITINYNQTQNHQCIGLVPINLLLKLNGEVPSAKREKVTMVYDIKNMKSIFKSNIQKEIIRNILQIEKLEDGTYRRHIVFYGSTY